MRQHSVVREGVIAGVLGAAAVAVWFLVVDVVTGRPLYTPEVLGRGVLSLVGVNEGDSPAMLIALYSVLHVVAFILVGMVAIAIVHAGEREPSVLAGALILFVAIEIGFYGLSALLSQAPALGTLAWYQVGLANLLAALVMGVYLWRTHPALGGGLNRALGGRE